MSRQDEIAAEVRSACDHLNRAFAVAHEDGLRVDVSVDYLRRIDLPHSQPVVRAEIERVVRL